MTAKVTKKKKRNHKPKEQSGINLNIYEKTSQITSQKARINERYEKLRQTCRKLQRLQNKHKSLQSKYLEEKKERVSLEKELLALKKLHKKQNSKLTKVERSLSNARQALGEEIKTVKSLREENRVYNLIAKEGREAMVTLKDYNAELNEKDAHITELGETIDFLEEIINDDDNTITLYDKLSKYYSTEAQECVMNLTDVGVSSRSVGKVIEEVSKLCGKTVDRVPSRHTVDRINTQKVAVVQTQLHSIQSKTNTTLYTDETSKFGKSYGVYVISDSEKNTYILGLREMSSKSAKTTLDTFNEILQDINDACSLKEEEKQEENIGYKILSNIKNTMSDRASTEKKFNELLENYRESILQEAVQGWTDMDENERKVISRMNNFFCGLHLLVGAADACAETLRKFEGCTLQGAKVGAENDNKSGDSEVKQQEAGVIRLIRTCSKAFGRGVDEKSGCFQYWKTYCDQNNVKPLFVRYRHNRFNIFFVLAQYVYYHRKRIVQFLKEKHEASKRLLSSVLSDIEVPLYLGGCRVLGLISKLITAPLWRLIEDGGDILDMNRHYLTLYTYLREHANDASEFLKGNGPFSDMVEHDSILDELLCDEDNDPASLAQTRGIAEALMTSLKCMLERQLSDQLPGGKFANATTELYQETASTVKHNKLPEFIFGQLDYIIRCRPNASILANEAMILYSYNKTSEWLNQLGERDRAAIIKDSMENRKVLYAKFAQRKKELKEAMIKKLEDKAREIKEKEERRLKLKEKMTSDICYYRLWQSDSDIDKFLSEISTETERKKALKVQLNFRKKVLKQASPEKDTYLFSYKVQGKTKQCTSEQLTVKLKQLVTASFSLPSPQNQEDDRRPLFSDRKITHKFHDGTYTGRVISAVPGFPEWFSVLYEGDEAIYTYKGGGTIR